MSKNAAHDNRKRFGGAYRKQRQREGRGGGKQGGYKWIGQPLTGKQANQQAHAEAGLQFNPLLRAERAELHGNERRANQEIPAWFGQLDQTYAQGQQAALASQQSAQQALQQQLQTSQAGAQQNQAALIGQNAELAKLVGAEASAFAPAAQEQAAAAQQRSLTQNALAMPIIAAGANNANFLAAQRGAAARDSLYQRIRQRKRGDKIREDLHATQREKGASQVEALGKLREGERNFRVQRKAFGFEKQKFGAEQGLEEKKFGQSQAEFETEQKNKERELAQRERELNQEGARVNGEGGGKGPSEREEHWSNAKSTAKTLFEKQEWPSWAALTQHVAEEGEVPPAMARRAVQRLRKHVEREEKKKRKFTKIKKAAGGGW